MLTPADDIELVYTRIINRQAGLPQLIGVDISAEVYCCFSQNIAINVKGYVYPDSHAYPVQNAPLLVYKTTQPATVQRGLSKILLRFKSDKLTEGKFIFGIDFFNKDEKKLKSFSNAAAFQITAGSPAHEKSYSPLNGGLSDDQSAEWRFEPCHLNSNDIFNNSQLELALCKNGYALLPPVEEEILLKLRDYCFSRLSRYSIEEDNKTVITIKESDLELRYSAHMFIANSLSPYLSRLFVNYKILISSFIIKLKDSKTEIGFHQEPTFTNPEEYEDFTIWIPLVDVPKDAGVLSIVRHSHLWANKINYYLHRPEYLEQVDYSQTDDIEAKAGAAVIFFNRTIHASKPNTKIDYRPAVSLKITNRNALIYSYYDAERKGCAERYRQDDLFYFKPGWNQEVRPDKSKFDAIIEIY